jgi:WD repeat-containing protein 23
MTDTSVLATSWNGWDHGLGTCTVHSWNDGNDSDEGEPKMGARLNAQLEEDSRYYETTTAPSGRATSSRRSRFVTRAQLARDEEEEE